MSRHARTSAPATVTDAGTLAGQLVPWNLPATVRDAAGADGYTESWAPDSLHPASVVPVYAGHVHTDTPGELVRGPLIGRVADLESRPDGLYGTVQLANTPDAQTIRELARTVGAAFSVEFIDTQPDPQPGSTVMRTDAVLAGLSVILPPYSPAYPTAQVTNIRSDPMLPSASTTDPYTPPGQPEPAPNDPPTDPPPAPEPAPNDPPANPPEDMSGRVSEIVRAELARFQTAAVRQPVHPLARYDSFGAFAAAQWTASEEEHAAQGRELGRALADITTTSAPGLLPPSWVSDVKGIVNLGRPFITHIGTTPDTGHGMEVNWPFSTVDIKTVVGEQAAEKSPIVSVVVPIAKGTADLVTYAGGSDISYQLIRRSSPAYIDAYLRIMAAGMAWVTDAAAATAALAAATGHVVWDPAAADPNGQLFKAAVFAASVDVQNATGQPADVVLAADDVFIKAGAVLTPRPIMNAAGAAEASTLLVDVSGLEVIRVPSFPAGAALVTNRAACGWMEDGPFVVNQEDVEKLGRNVAVWSMGALTPFAPKGLVKLAP
jgi:hypothetical protein